MMNRVSVRGFVEHHSKRVGQTQLLVSLLMSCFATAELVGVRQKAE